MSYRNDHDAALARIDALEGELEDVKAERDRLRCGPSAMSGVHAGPAPSEAGMLLLVLGIIIMIAAVAAGR